jgi:hypothetical protein
MLTLHRPDEPVEQVHVVARLIHECAAVELPGPAPGGAVVVGLRPAPEDVDVDHVNPAEASLLYRALEQLQRGITPVLLDDEQVNAGVIAGMNHALPVPPARSHGLLRHDVSPRRRNLYRLLGMKTAGRRQDHHIGIGPCQ